MASWKVRFAASVVVFSDIERLKKGTGARSSLRAQRQTRERRRGFGHGSRAEPLTGSIHRVKPGFNHNPTSSSSREAVARPKGWHPETRRAPPRPSAARHQTRGSGRGFGYAPLAVTFSIDRTRQTLFQSEADAPIVARTLRPAQKLAPPPQNAPDFSQPQLYFRGTSRRARHDGTRARAR